MSCVILFLFMSHALVVIALVSKTAMGILSDILCVVLLHLL